MELSCSPSLSPLTISRPNYKLSRLQTRNYCNLTKICSPISASLGFYGYGSCSNAENIATVDYKRNIIRACDKSRSDPITVERARNSGEIFWRFARPHSFIGTIIMSSSLLARVLIDNPNLIELSLVSKALSGLFTLICANCYTNGINQIYDVEIDKINKPFLPLPAGDLSVTSAWLFTVFSAAAGLTVVGLTCDMVITCAYGLGLLMSTAYSAPPLRIKRFAFGPIFCVTMATGVLLNFGIYYSLRATLGLAFQWSTPLIYILTFGLVMCPVLAMNKDLSDVEGDAKYGISTLAIKLGARNVAYLGCGVLLAYYGATMLASLYMPQALNAKVIIPAQFVFALRLIHQMRVLEQENYSPEASLKFYMALCSLFIGGYIIFPFI